MKNDLKVTLGQIVALLEEQVLTQNVNYHINMQILAKCLCQPKQTIFSQVIGKFPSPLLGGVYFNPIAPHQCAQICLLLFDFVEFIKFTICAEI
jgi:hypothetical protein